MKKFYYLKRIIPVMDEKIIAASIILFLYFLSLPFLSLPFLSLPFLSLPFLSLPFASSRKTEGADAPFWMPELSFMASWMGKPSITASITKGATEEISVRKRLLPSKGSP